MAHVDGGAAPPGGDAAPKYLTAEDLDAALGEKLTKVLNAALTGHVGRLEKKLAGQFEERLKAFQPPKVEGAEGDITETVEVKTPKGAETAKATDDPRYTTLLAELEAQKKRTAKLEKEHETAQKNAASERTKRLETDGHAALTRALAGKVSAGAEPIVLATLRGRGAVHIDDAGAVRLRLGGKDEPEDGLDLEEGIASYLKSTEAKFFLPAPNAGPPARKTTAQTHTPPPGTKPGTTQAASPVAALEQATGKTIESLL